MQTDEDLVTTMERAELVLATLTNFLNSSSVSVGQEHLPERRKCALLEPPQSGRIVEAARQLWVAMADPASAEVPMTHNGYMKLYSLSRPRLKADVVMLDEAQDCNPAIGSIVVSQPCARLLVGDGHQAIYGFLGAQDMLRQRSSAGSGTVIRRQLTRSFRFGPNIADVASHLLSRAKGELRPVLGCRVEPGEVLFDAESICEVLCNPSRPRELRGSAALVSRSNAAVLTHALRADAYELSLEWVGGVRSYRLGLLKDLCRLRLGETQDLETARLKAFRSLDAVKRFAERVEDRELAAKAKLVINCEDTEALLERLRRLEANAERREKAAHAQPADLAVCTVHKAKGLEWEEVFVADDFADPGDAANVDAQELNMLYVALTRCRRVLHMPSSRASRAFFGDREAPALVRRELALPAQGPTSQLVECPFCEEYFEVPRLSSLSAAAPGPVCVASVSLQRLCRDCSEGVLGSLRPRPL